VGWEVGSGQLHLTEWLFLGKKWQSAIRREEGSFGVEKRIQCALDVCWYHWNVSLRREGDVNRALGRCNIWAVLDSILWHSLEEMLLN
jgi:hypothetical protein